MPVRSRVEALGWHAPGLEINLNQDLALAQIRVRWRSDIDHPEIEAMKCALWKLDTAEMRARMEALVARHNALHGAGSHWIEARDRTATPVNL